MSVLRSIESKIEGLFEGVFGRAFRTNVQPVELARRLAKEMDENRSVSVSRVYVPNEYTVYLSPGDREVFTSYEGSLIGELQEYLTEHAARERYALLTPPRVLITTDEDLATGEFGIATRVVQPPEAAAPPALPPIEAPAVTHTVVYPPSEPAPLPEPAPAPPPEPVATLHVGETAYPVDAAATIGRSRECDVQLNDTNVSRRHAEVTREGDTWWITDLDSTNGTEVNGRRVDRARLEDGDRIRIGGTDLAFSRTDP